MMMNDDDDNCGDSDDGGGGNCYCRYGGELLPKLIPSLAALSTNLENLEWLVNLNSSVGDLVHSFTSCAFHAVTYMQCTCSV